MATLVAHRPRALRAGGGLAPQAHRAQGGGDPLPSLGARDPGEDHGKGHVLCRVEAGNQMEALEDESDLVAPNRGQLLFRERSHIFAAQAIDTPVGRSRHPRTFSSVDLPDPEGPTTAT